jgi:hypothetical protein
MSAYFRSLTLRILGLALFASGLLLGVTHAMPLSSGVLQGLGMCDNPCWIGIEPGVTAFDHVPELVNAQRPDLVLLLQQLSGSPSYTFQPPAFDGAIRQQVGYIRLDLRIPLWRLLVLLDSPTCVRTLGNPIRPAMLEIIWEDEEIALISNILLERHNHDLDSHSLTLWSSAYLLCETFDAAQPWPGWVSLQRQVWQS